MTDNEMTGGEAICRPPPRGPTADKGAMVNKSELDEIEKSPVVLPHWLHGVGIAL